jgi:hypothetical protein
MKNKNNNNKWHAYSLIKNILIENGIFKDKEKYDEFLIKLAEILEI